jgi:hypothetical protein
VAPPNWFSFHPGTFALSKSISQLLCVIVDTREPSSTAESIALIAHTLSRHELLPKTLDTPRLACTTKSVHCTDMLSKGLRDGT